VSGHGLVCRGAGEGERGRGGHRAPPGRRCRDALATQRAWPAAVGIVGHASGRGRRPRGRGPGHGTVAGARAGGENRATLASGPKGKRRPATVRNGFPILFPNKFSNNSN
jgi:hypothetical protein